MSWDLCSAGHCAGWPVVSVPWSWFAPARWRRWIGIFAFKDHVTGSACSTSRLIAFKLSQSRVATGLTERDQTTDLIELAAVSLKRISGQTLGFIHSNGLLRRLGF